MNFLFSLVLAVTVLVTPGFLLLYELKRGLVASVVSAPLISILLYVFLGIIYEKMHIPCNAFSLLSGTAILLILSSIIIKVFLVRRLDMKGTRSGSSHSLAVIRQELFQMIPIVVVPLLISSLFLLRLGGSSNLIQGYDTVFHVNLIRSFVDSSIWSSSSATLYPLGDAPIPLTVNSVAFYPAGWHIVAATVYSITHAPMASVINAVDVAFTSFVFPLGVWGLLRVTLSDKRAAFLGALCSTAFVAYPWLPLLRGEQLPQIASFALVPSCAMLFVCIFSADQTNRDRFVGAVLFLLGLISLVFVQTNAVFTVGIICAWYVAHFIITRSGWRPQTRALALSFWCLTVFAVWIVFFLAPFMQDTVQFSWPSFTTLPHAVYDVLVLRLAQGGSSQPFLAAVVLFGVLVCMLGASRRRWIAGVWLTAGLIYAIDISNNGILKHLLSGFWYTDPDRTSAMLSIFLLLPAAIGLGRLSRILEKLVRRVATHFQKPSLCIPSTNIVFSVVVAVFIASPWVYFGLAEGPFTFETSQKKVFDQLAWLSDPSSATILSDDEKSFAERVKSVVPEDALILNVPDDGSSFLYGLYDMNVFYHRGGMGKAESRESRLMRMYLYTYPYSDSVQEAVKKTGAEYVLVLDSPDETAGKRGVFHTYKRAAWAGFEEISTSTSGFELILCEGDMRLYRINSIFP